MSKYLFLIVLASLLMACPNPTDSNNEDATDDMTLTTAPAALEEYDASHLGVYKGVIAGESFSASFWVSLTEVPAAASQRGLAPSDANVEINLLVNNSQIVELTTSAVDNLEGGYYFSTEWTVDSQTYTMDMTVDNTGHVLDPAVSSGDELLTIAVVKETSTQPVSTWEGTYSGGGSGPGYSYSVGGTWNFTLKGTAVNGAYAGQVTSGENTAEDGSTFTGTLSGNAVTLSGAGPDAASGSFSGFDLGSRVTGTWSGSEDPAGTGSGSWSGKRKQ